MIYIFFKQKLFLKTLNMQIQNYISFHEIVLRYASKTVHIPIEINIVTFTFLTCLISEVFSV